MENWEKELLLTNALRAQKIDSFEKAITEDLSKGKAANIGEIREWSGKKYKKQANGKWVEVSEHKMTSKEHEDLYSKNKERASTVLDEYRQGYENTAKSNKEIASKLSGKEHSDEEVGLGEEKKKDKNDLPKKLSEIVLKHLVNKNNIFSEQLAFSIFDREAFKAEYKERLPSSLAGPTKAMMSSNILNPMLNEQTYVDGGELVLGDKTVLRLTDKTTWKDVVDALKIKLTVDEKTGKEAGLGEENKKQSSKKKELSFSEILSALKDSPKGSIASGGGYGPFVKISSNSWLQERTKTLMHSEALRSHIGGFKDFKIKS